MIATIYDQTGSYQLGWQLLIALTVITMVTWIFSMKMARGKSGVLETK
jgi:hypothetical protein